jgi:catechol 2,3-dioxygenase-like lactoylglutathione lyase family enzyme
MMGQEQAAATRPALVGRITTVEVPVSDLSRAIAWYERHLGLTVTWRGEHEASLALPSSGPEHGAPALFLVQTEDETRLGFRNTRERFLQSVIDFYTPDLAGLHARLEGAGVDVNPLLPGARGFGFRDADGNSLGAHSVA